MAEQRGFVDLYVLTVTRGVTYRLLGRPAEALMDFVNACDLLNSNNKVYYTILYYTILYIILYYTILYYTILYYTVLYYTVIYYIILYCTILFNTIAAPTCCSVTGQMNTTRLLAHTSSKI